MNMTTEKGMKRGEFLKSLGLSTSTLMAFYCLGTTMTACGSKDDNPDPGNPGGGGGTGITGTTTGSAINFTIDTTNSEIISKLLSGSKYIITGDVLVARTTSGAYVALAKACTHQQTELQFRSATNDLVCINHGSEFSSAGAVNKKPSTGENIVALKAYKTSLSTDGKTLTVTA